MSGVSNLTKDTAGIKTLTSESRPCALSTHPAPYKTEKAWNPPQVVLVGVEHREAPSLQT